MWLQNTARVLFQVGVLLLVDSDDERVSVFVLLGVGHQIANAGRQRHALAGVLDAKLLHQLLQLIDVARHVRSELRLCTRTRPNDHTHLNKTNVTFSSGRADHATGQGSGRVELHTHECDELRHRAFAGELHFQRTTASGDTTGFRTVIMQHRISQLSFTSVQNLLTEFKRS